MRADTTDGTTEVTSNGIVILPINVPVSGLDIKDGRLCALVQGRPNSSKMGLLVMLLLSHRVCKVILTNSCYLYLWYYS